MRERRQSARVPFDTTANLKVGDMVYEKCDVRDLSIRGAWVCGVQGPRVGERCEVALHMAGTISSLVLHMRSEVVRIKGECLALRFLEMDPDTYDHLRNIVRYNAEGVAAVEEDFS